MKNIFIHITIILAILFIADSNAKAQKDVPAGKVYGIIADSLSKQPLELVTVMLKTEKDSLIKTRVSKAGGKFELENLHLKKYNLVILFAGYEKKIVPVTLTDNKINSDFGTIYLSKRVNNLKEVEIKGDKLIIQQKADRIIYDMAADPESKVNNVLSMIHKIPYLSVDADDNVLMKGSSSYKVLINGKPSGMLTNNLKEVLRSMPASTVVRIEVITIPPSKYDAEGMAGIINIITNKKVSDGYKGTLNASEGLPQGGPGVGASFTAQQGKFGINSYGGASMYNEPQTTYTMSRNTTGVDPTTLQQNGYNKSDSKNGYFGAELSYEIDSLNLLSGNFDINDNNYHGLDDQTSVLNGSTGLLQSYDLDNTNHGHRGGFDAAVNYQLGFKSSKNTLLTFSYQYSTYSSNAYTNVDISNPVDYPTPDYNQLNYQDSKEQTIQVDYAHPINKVNMEAGLKAILRNSKSNAEYNSFNATDGLFEPDSALSDMFNYTQDVYGAYNSYQFSLKKWSFNAGLRAEYTDVNADFASNGSNTKQNYFNVIPSLSINKSFKDNSSINFGFTQRLRRPSIYRLNPFVDRSNPDFISTGNPNLRPVIMNIIQLGYSNGGGKKVSVYIGTDYTFFNNLDLQVTSYDPLTQITKTTYGNVGKGGGIEGNLNINYAPVKFYNLSINANALCLFVNGTGDASADKLNRTLSHASLSNGFKFNKGWSMNANFDYYSPTPLSLQGVNNGFASTSLSVNKELVKNKLFFSTGVNNPFTKYRNKRTETDGPGFTQTSDNLAYFRSVNFSINYNFGKLNSDIKKSRKSINNDDVSKSGGGM
ncbi:TonB-dependent receptor domain-containing protein [Mucilaginibacter sp. X5P1]|uniref:TonB-dependent receptor domain-containing protein n=1 Tax=Mucilaginibacter sp. X5P1 TaxID=2723088 RepID=UPI001620E5A4|nr:TonB-dependent receptor [Mucilaginibacter sp. X5P1]MBB6136978.1 outer membrane receptor protein involved in Fe transport [Mucilaginibacter sp. X5P1]